jgi:hypothetical protein
MEHLRELKEKLAIVLIVLGVAGIAAYVYAQLTSVSTRARLMPPGMSRFLTGDIPPMYERDWTVWLVWAIIGAILLGFGVYRLRRFRKARKPAA